MTPFILRRWQESDIPALAKYLNNKKIWDNCRDSLPYPYTSEDAASFIQYVKSQDIQNNYCIEVHAEAAGNISFDRGTDVERFNAEIGYWIAERRLCVKLSAIISTKLMSCGFLLKFMPATLPPYGYWKRLVSKKRVFNTMLVSRMVSFWIAIVSSC